MKINNMKETFVLLLNDLRQGAEKANEFFRELVPIVQEPEVKEIVEARVFLSGKIIETLDQCFKLMGEKPAPLNGSFLEIFFEDFREELGGIQSSEAKHLFILAKANTLLHIRIGQYTALTAAADASGHYGVASLLESCHADKLAFAERVRRLIQKRREVMKATA